MQDLISRQAAIDALEQIFDRCEEIEAHLPEGDPDRTGYKMYPDYMTVWKYLHQLQSAQPDLDSAYTEGYTQAEAKYRAMIDEQSTIEERKTGKWVDGKCNSVNIVHTAVQDSCRKERNHDEMGSRRKRLHMQ